MQTLSFEIKGIAPLLLHSARLSDPLDDIAKQMKAISSKKTKTDADHEDMAKLEWVGSLYFDNEVGPYIPGYNFVAMMIEAGRLTKKGRIVERALIALDHEVPLKYKGPRALEALWADSKFRDRRSVGVMDKRVMRTRPKFDDWSCSLGLGFNEEMINAAEVVELVKSAGASIGVGDFRPRFGRFEVTSYK